MSSILLNVVVLTVEIILQQVCAALGLADSEEVGANADLQHVIDSDG